MQRAREMVDNIQAVVPSERLLPRWLREELASQPAALSETGDVLTQRRVSLSIGNINIRLNSQGKPVVENSPHRFYHGHNGGNFTRSDVAAAIEKLSDTLGFDVSLCEVRRVEIGVNVLPTAPNGVQEALRALQAYKDKSFTKWERGTAVTGAKRLLTEYELKCYDKSLELKRQHVTLASPTLRWEIASKKIAYVRRLGVVTVADLATPSFFKAGGDELVARLEACSFAEQLNYSLLTGDELEALALVQNGELWRAYKADRTDKNKVARRRTVAEQAKLKAAATNVKAELLWLVQEAISELT